MNNLFKNRMPRNTNKRKALKAVLLGLIFCVLVVANLSPKSKSISIHSNEKGAYSQTVETSEYTVAVSEYKHDYLVIEYQAKRSWWLYVFAIGLGAAMGVSSYRAVGTNKKKAQFDPRIVTEHPRYAEFLELDADRSFYSGDELVFVFNAWLSDQLNNKQNQNNADKA